MAENGENKEHEVRTKLILLGISLSVVILAFGGYYFARWRGFDIAEQVEVANVAMTAFLTVALIGVYLQVANALRTQAETARSQTQSLENQADEIKKQAQLQEQVADLQETQTKILKANHTPSIEVVDRFIKDESEGEEDVIFLSLKNKGNGFAQNIQILGKIWVFVDFSTGEAYVGLNEYLSRGAPTPEGPLPHPTPLLLASSNIQGERGAVLQPGEEELLKGTLRFEKRKFDYQKEEFVITDKISFSEILSRVSDAGSISLSLHIRYQDVLGVNYQDEIYSEYGEIGDAVTVRELLGDLDQR